MSLFVLIALGALAALAGLAWWFAAHGPFRPVKLEAQALPRCDRISRESLLQSFAEHVYGPEPPRIRPRVISREPIAAAQAGGVDGVEQWRIDLGAAGVFHLVLVIPPNLQTPAPLILMQNFTGNRAAFPGRPEAIAAPSQWYPWICKEPRCEPALRATFGEHICTPPYALIAERGYALAMAYAGDIVPDHPKHARRALATFAPPRTGALSAWAWVHARALDVLAQDARIDAARISVWGQSRQGKTALLAGARDERFAAVVALQSGRGGDAPTRRRTGESVRAATLQFPHWFSPRFRDYVRKDPPVDQHELLALIAPRPLLIGHAWRDGWADPAGARAAVEAAGAAWECEGAPRPHFFMRDGRHGIARADWEETLDFLDARLVRQSSSSFASAG